MEKRLKTVLSSYRGKKDELIPILQKTQEEFGHLAEEVMQEIARFTRVPESRVYAVASFYSQFRFTPLGKYKVMVCRGTACHVGGVPKILEEVKRHLGIEEGETTADLEYSLETVACIGCCALAPCVMINDKVQAKMTPKKVAKLFGARR